jgi:hypothetical protein
MTSPASERSLVERSDVSSTMPARPDGEPALELHEDPAQDVDQEALQRKSEQQHDQRGPRERAVASHAGQLRDGEERRQHVRHVTHARLHERDDRLVALERDDHVRAGALGIDVPGLVTADDPLGQSLREPGGDPGQHERDGDEGRPAPRLGQEMELNDPHAARLPVARGGQVRAVGGPHLVRTS